VEKAGGLGLVVSVLLDTAQKYHLNFAERDDVETLLLGRKFKHEQHFRQEAANAAKFVISRRKSAYVDCEFCSFEDPRPISIGAVCGGAEFYGEFPLDLPLCSDFVRQHVIPRLGGGADPIEINEWAHVNRVHEFVVDTSYDEKILKILIPSAKVRHVKQLPQAEREKLFTHHALEDARVLQGLARNPSHSSDPGSRTPANKTALDSLT
jgi:hypothetical protein